MRHAVVLCVLGLAGCARVTSSPPPAPRATPPSLRLPPGARPTGYAVSLRVDPDQPRFAGTVDIDIALDASTSLLWLNASDLRLERADVTAGGTRRPVQVVAGDTDFTGFAFDPPLGPGPIRLRVAYQGRIYDHEQAGVFRQTDRGARYQFTQFEAFDARRAFPCFDEPGFKTPWRLSLTVPSKLVAVSNAPALGERDQGGGWKTVSFAVTRPLPSYLVAFAVGPFDLVDGGRSGAAHTPLRLVVPRGRAGEAGPARGTVGPLVEALEALTGVPFPYPKLDVVAIPQFPGAMENAGLITCASSLLLSRPGEETVSGRRALADFLAHEIAHHWFGDLVTASWWDELWLNEAFASWAGPHAVDRWKPEWNLDVHRVLDRADAVDLDALASARQVRQPILTKDDIGNAFDDITYEKGRAVLEMFQAWLGPETFWRGVRRYLERHRDGVATSRDLLADLSAQAGRDVAPAFSSFLDQPGVPVVSVELVCPAGGQPRVTLEQSRYLPVGSSGRRDQRWQLPVCLRYGDDQESHRRCLFLDRPRLEAVLDDAARCPSWILGNDRMTGYYVANSPLPASAALLAPQGSLTLAERVGVLRDLEALVDSGQRQAGQVLDLLPELVRDPRTSPHLIRIAAAMIDGLDHHLVAPALRASYVRLVQALFGDRARALGFTPRPGESEEDKLLRTTLVPLVAGAGQDRALAAEGARLLRAWLDDRSAVDPDLVEAAVKAATPRGDRALFDRLVAEARKPTTERADRMRITRALGQFDDPALVRAAFMLFLSGELETEQSMGLLFRRRRTPASDQINYRLLEEHYQEVVARLPRNGDLVPEARLPELAGSACDERARAEVEAFFRPRAARVVGGPRNLDQVLEGIGLCVAVRRAQQDSVSAFLRRW
jgi:alanyl aminopeptidase